MPHPNNTMKHLADIRKDYMLKTLTEDAVHQNPIEQFRIWFDEALQCEIDEINAMTLATVDEHHKPHARIVLLKGVQENGFTFFTNYTSHKGQQLEQNPYVALIIFWKELERQIRIEGVAQKLSPQESDEYFHSRPILSQIGAWTSPQSQEIPDRDFLDQRFASLQKEFKNKPIQRPPHWGGFLVVPHSIEFWQGRESRLHDRLVYTKENESWKIARLAP